MNDLSTKKCKPCAGGDKPLDGKAVEELLKQLDGWKIDAGQLHKEFKFKNYHETMAFVNASAWISHREDHHPDLVVAYNTCAVSYVTHAIGGLSDNDFICAAKIDALFR